MTKALDDAPRIPSGIHGLAKALLVGVFLLFVALTFFVWPSSDDYGFAHHYSSQSLVTCHKVVNGETVAVDFPCHRYYSFDNPTRKAGLFDLAINEYLTFVGRYSTNLVAFYLQGELAKTLGGFEFHKYYPLISQSMLLLFFAAAWIFARQGGYSREHLSSGHLFWGCLGFVTLYLLHMPHLASSIYQISQLLMHQLCLALSLVMLALLARYQNSPPGWLRKTWAGLGLITLIGVMGASEIILFWNGTFVFLILVAAQWTRQSNRRFYQIAFGMAVLCAAAVVLAPGTLSRIGETSSVAIPMQESLARSFYWGGRYLASWVMSPVLWAMSVIMLPYAFAMVRSHAWFKRVRLIHVVLFAILWAGMICASWMLLAGIGREMPARVINGIYFYFLLGWWIGLHLLLASLSIDALPLWLTRNNRISLLFMVFFCAGLILPGPGLLRSQNNFLRAITDLQGPLWNYRQQQQERLAIIREARNNGKTEVTLPPFREVPSTVFYEDVVPHQCSNWRNRFMGALYGLRTVCVE
ncbi:MAG: hypothetical protein HQL74_04470 [Magnetococcales bacterium]|nr:hypothetical protein [Magnetococcales bacterium]